MKVILTNFICMQKIYVNSSMNFDQKAGIKHTGIKHFNDPNAFIEGSNKMDHVYENMY